MSLYPFRKLLFVVFVAALSGVTMAAPQEKAREDEKGSILAQRAVKLLRRKCFPCHGGKPDKIKGEFDLTTRNGLIAGGESGHPGMQPGRPKASAIYRAARREDPDFEMPPKENDRLTVAELELLRDWIAAGAPWAQESEGTGGWSETPEGGGIRVRTSGGLSSHWDERGYAPADLWAFKPLRDVEVPRTAADEHPIDAFIRRRLAERDLEPASSAGDATLYRRASFDLTGLPPKPWEVTRYREDAAPDKWSKAIDRLLASPRYGEQWGRHWLDVVRYADTSGGSNDFERSNAWRYRDYVIRAFNQDKPYDRFILEQLAGDELEPENPEMLVATGFLRMGPWEHTAMAPVPKTRQQYLDDVTNSVGQAFMSIPLRCASCHDHKFDPIPTRDYYRIQAVFAATHPAERPADFSDWENRSGFVPGRAQVQARLDAARAEVAKLMAKQEKAARAWCKERDIAYAPREKLKGKPEDQKPPRHIGLDYADQGYLKLCQGNARIWQRRLERYEPMAQSIYSSSRANMTQNSRNLRMKPLKGQGPPTHILAGGAVDSPGVEVVPAVLSAVGAVGGLPDPEIPRAPSGRRLAFARWLADPQNPLATRSIVNRVWQYHFGRGLASNPNNFGKTGAKPTHPDLLDWLAGWFVGHGRSIKALHRLIMTSETYRRTSQPPDSAAVAVRDSGNELLSFFSPRRLSAEELRDTVLFVSGELNPSLGGLPAFPEIALEVALQPRMLQFSLAPAYQPSMTPAQRHRRSIYAYRCRGQGHPMLEVFNQPTSDDSCEHRETSTVTPQVFSLFNSGGMYDRAIAMALRLEAMAENLPDQVGRAIRHAYGRPPSSRERRLLVEHAEMQLKYHREHSPDPSRPPFRVKRSVVEEFTGLAFDYFEQLDVYRGWTPDKKPWDVGPQTRALAEVCLVLFNSNEFLYVY